MSPFALTCLSASELFCAATVTRVLSGKSTLAKTHASIFNSESSIAKQDL